MMLSNPFVAPVRSIDQDPKFKCFRCVPVRTASLAHGFYTFFIQMLFAAVLILVLLHRERFFNKYHTIDQSTITIEFYQQPENDAVVAPGHDIFDPNAPRIPKEPLRRARHVDSALRELQQPGMDSEEFGEITFIKQDDIEPAYPSYEWPMSNVQKMSRHDAQLGLIFSFSLIVTTIFMIHGVLYHRPIYILPYFSYLLFDFIIACLYTIGHSQWTHQIEAIAERSQYKLTQGQVQMIMLLVLLSCVCILFFKAYMIGIFWSTYQYAVLRQCMSRRFELEVMRPMPSPSRTDAALKAAELNLLPPKYEDAEQMPVEPPPPRYDESAPKQSV